MTDFQAICNWSAVIVAFMCHAQKPQNDPKRCYSSEHVRTWCQSAEQQKDQLEFSNFWEQQDIQILEASLQLTMENWCGICGAKGLKKQLVLFQLNLEEAILMCESKEVCTFSWISLLPFIGLVLRSLKYLSTWPSYFVYFSSVFILWE